MSDIVEKLNQQDNNKQLSVQDLQYATEYFGDADRKEVINGLEDTLREDFQDHIETLYADLGARLEKHEELSKQEIELLQLCGYMKQLHQGVRYGYDGEINKPIVIDGVRGKQTDAIIHSLCPSCIIYEKLEQASCSGETKVIFEEVLSLFTDTEIHKQFPEFSAEIVKYRWERNKKFLENMRQQDQVSDIISQFIEDESFQIAGDISRDEFVSIYPDQAQKLQDSMMVSENTAVVLPGNENYNLPSIPNNIVRFSLTGGESFIVKIAGDIQKELADRKKEGETFILVSTKNNQDENYNPYFGFQNGYELSRDNFRTIKQNENGGLELRKLTGEKDTTVSARQAVDVLMSQQDMMGSLNSAEFKEMTKDLDGMQEAITPLQEVYKEFQEGGLFSKMFSENTDVGVDEQELHEIQTKAYTFSTTGLVYLESQTDHWKEQRTRLQQLLSELDDDSPLVGIQWQIKEMIDAYDNLITKCEKGKDGCSPLRSFINILINPAQFYQNDGINWKSFKNFLKISGPAIVGGVIAGIAAFNVIVGTGGMAAVPLSALLAATAVGTAGGMLLGKGLQKISSQRGAFDSKVIINGKELILDFDNPTNVELWLEGKITGKELTGQLFQEFTMQFVMQLVFMKGIQGASTYINKHLAQFPNGRAAKFFKILKPTVLDDLGKQIGKTKVGSTVKAGVNKVSKSRIGKVGKSKTLGETAEEHWEELTEDFIDTASNQNGVGTLTVFLIHSFKAISPRNSSAKHANFFEENHIEQVGNLWKQGDNSVLQKLQTKAWDKLDNMIDFYRGEGFSVVEQNNGKVFFERKTVLDGEEGVQRVELGNSLNSDKITEDGNIEPVIDQKIFEKYVKEYSYFLREKGLEASEIEKKVKEHNRELEHVARWLPILEKHGFNRFHFGNSLDGFPSDENKIRLAIKRSGQLKNAGFLLSLDHIKNIPDNEELIKDALQWGPSFKKEGYFLEFWDIGKLKSFEKSKTGFKGVTYQDRSINTDTNGDFVFDEYFMIKEGQLFKNVADVLKSGTPEEQILALVTQLNMEGHLAKHDSTLGACGYSSFFLQESLKKIHDLGLKPSFEIINHNNRNIGGNGSHEFLVIKFESGKNYLLDNTFSQFFNSKMINYKGRWGSQLQGKPEYQNLAEELLKTGFIELNQMTIDMFQQVVSGEVGNKNNVEKYLHSSSDLSQDYDTDDFPDYYMQKIEQLVLNKLEGKISKNLYNFSSKIQRENSLNSDKLIDEKGIINLEAKQNIEKFMRENGVLKEGELLSDEQVRNIYEVHTMKRMEGETDDVALNYRKGLGMRKLFNQEQIRVLMEGKVCGIFDIFKKQDKEDILETNHLSTKKYNRKFKKFNSSLKVGESVDMSLAGESIQVVRLSKGECIARRLNPNIEFFIFDTQLYKETGGEKGFKALRDGESVVLGRNHLSDRFNFSSYVSGNHLKINRIGEEIYFEDLNSTNGSTLVSKTTMSESIISEKLKNKESSNDMLSMRNLRYIEDGGGSNGGKWYEHIETGKKYFVKEYQNKDQGGSEFIANKIYQKLGLHAPKSYIIDGRYLATEKIEGSERIDNVAGVKSGFVIDCILANRDGTKHSNMLQTNSGDIYRIDNGGSLFFRAQGGYKESFGSGKVNELLTLKDPNINSFASKYYGDITDNEILQQIKNIKNVLTDNIINEIVNSSNIGNKEAVIQSLIARRDWIYTEYSILENKKQRKSVEYSQISKYDQETLSRINDKQSVLGRIPKMKWTHRTDFETLHMILKSGNMGSNQDRGINFWGGLGAGYGDVTIIMKDSVSSLPASNDVTGSIVPGTENMTYFRGNSARGNGMKLDEYTQNFGDFSHIRKFKGDNVHLNSPYLMVGQNGKGQFKHTVDISYIESVMLPKHLQSNPKYGLIVGKLESLGIRVIEMQTDGSILDYAGGSIVNAEDPRRGSYGESIKAELSALYPTLSFKEAVIKLMVYKLPKLGRNMTGNINDDFKFLKDSYNQIAADHGLSRANYNRTGQFENYVSQKNYTKEQQAYFKYLIYSKY